jgi:molybdopterin/thiamine biosynthesis adenylyltransferase
MWTPDFGEAGQIKLKNSSVLVSRVGGLGGVVAYELAAAGVGRLVLAHAGQIKPSDLNRQLLATFASVGQSRIETAARRISELNPHIAVEPIAENISIKNAPRIIESVDLIVDCAPVFEERYAMNAEAVRQRKPLIECSMYDMEAHLTTIIPGKSPCLACLYPESPPAWSRKFPVFGAVSGSVGALAAMEAVKVIANIGKPLVGRMLVCDLRSMEFRSIRVSQRTDCAVCGI